VRVAEDDQARLVELKSALDRPAQMFRIHDVMEERAEVAALHKLDVADPGQRGVRVAQDCGHGRDLLQLMKDGLGPDVPAMKDEIDALKNPRNFRVEQSMGIGNDPEFHGRHPTFTPPNERRSTNRRSVINRASV